MRFQPSFEILPIDKQIENSQNKEWVLYHFMIIYPCYKDTLEMKLLGPTNKLLTNLQMYKSYKEKMGGKLTSENKIKKKFPI